MLAIFLIGVGVTFVVVGTAALSVPAALIVAGLMLFGAGVDLLTP